MSAALFIKERYKCFFSPSTFVILRFLVIFRKELDGRVRLNAIFLSQWFVGFMIGIYVRNNAL